MVYIVRIYVDGGCRRNGQSDAIGAAAVVVKSKRGGIIDSYGSCLPDYPHPTNQRAEITAIIHALQKVIDIDGSLRTNPWLDVKIYSDSKYAVSCMNQWIQKWSENGWVNAAGNPVANQDLIKQADNIEAYVRELGSLEYCWIPRIENQEADECVNELMDDHEQGLHYYGYDECSELRCLTSQSS